MGDIPFTVAKGLNHRRETRKSMPFTTSLIRVFARLYPQGFPSEIQFSKLWGKRRRRMVGILREDVSYSGLMNAWSEGIFQNHCARAISRAKVRIILRFKNINCHQAAAPPWWIHEGKAAYRATSFSLNTLACASPRLSRKSHRPQIFFATQIVESCAVLWTRRRPTS